MMKKTLRRSLGIFRVFLLAIAGLGGLAYFSFSASLARADDTLMSLGHQLLALSHGEFGKTKRGVLLNGQPLGFAVSTTTAALEEVLHSFEKWCRADPSFANEESFAHVAGDGGLSEYRLSSPHFSPMSGVQAQLLRRKVEGQSGFVACFRHREWGVSTQALGERLANFASSGNLSDFGHFYYAAAKTVEGQTRIVQVWTEGDFFPLELFSEAGDSPGLDPVNVARPPSGLRLLSAGEIGAQQEMTVYSDVKESVSSLRNFYKQDQENRGQDIVYDASFDEGHLIFASGDEGLKVLSIVENGESRGLSILVAPNSPQN